MVTTQTNVEEADKVSNFFGFSEMNDEEQVELLDSIGSSIFESALVRYLADAKEDEASAFQEYLDEHKENVDAFEQVATTFPRFATLVFEEAQAFRAEAMRLARQETALST